MSYRIIALDLDGTTLDSRARIRPRTKEAIDLARRRGIEVILVTGRHHVVTRPYHAELGLSAPAICCNGTYVYDFVEDRPVIGNFMNKDLARRLLATCRRHGVHNLIYVRDAMTYEVLNQHLVDLRAWVDAFPEAIRPALLQVDDFEEQIDIAPGVWKFVVSAPDPDRLTAWRADVESWSAGAFGLEYTWHDRIDVMTAGNSKGPRLLEWAAGRGIAPAEILAFGDNLNDVTMLAGVGHGIAMGNAEPALEAVADEIIGDNDSDAIAEAIERLV